MPGTIWKQLPASESLQTQLLSEFQEIGSTEMLPSATGEEAAGRGQDA